MTNQSGLSDETVQAFVLAFLRQGFTHAEIKDVIRDRDYAKAAVKAIREVRQNAGRRSSDPTQPQHVTKPATGDADSGGAQPSLCDGNVW